MLCREIIAVCSQIHIKSINTLCGQNGEMLNVKLVVVSRVTSGSLKTYFFRNVEGVNIDTGRVTVTHAVTALTPLEDSLSRTSLGSAAAAASCMLHAPTKYIFLVRGADTNVRAINCHRICGRKCTGTSYVHDCLYNYVFILFWSLKFA